MRYKAVIADVDGTLVPPSELPAPRPSSRLIEVVEKVIKKGVVFSLATARSLGWVKEVIEALKLNSLVILDNGARIYDCGNKCYLWESFLDREDVERVFSVLKNEKPLRIFLAEGEKRLDDPAKITKWEIGKIFILGLSPKTAEVLYQKLKIIPKVNVTKTISGADPPQESIHVTSYQATKQAALQKLAGLLKIKTSKIIGIGDSYNDYSFIKICGLKVAMGNATSDIKAIADYIAPSYQEDGVAEVLEKLILKNMRKNHFNSLIGEQKKQLLVVTDKRGQPIGQATREECHRGNGKTHLAFMAFVIDKEGKIILTRRSKKKSLWGGFWDASVVSHILPNETPEIAAGRRGKEELGVEVEFKNIGSFYYCAKFQAGSENEYCFVLVGNSGKRYHPNPVEIDAIRRITLEELKNEVGRTPDIFTPWLKTCLSNNDLVRSL